MPDYKVRITVDGEDHDVSFGNKPTDEDIDFVADQIRASRAKQPGMSPLSATTGMTGQVTPKQVLPGQTDYFNKVLAQPKPQVNVQPQVPTIQSALLNSPYGGGLSQQINNPTTGRPFGIEDVLPFLAPQNQPTPIQQPKTDEEKESTLPFDVQALRDAERSGMTQVKLKSGEPVGIDVARKIYQNRVGKPISGYGQQSDDDLALQAATNYGKFKDPSMREGARTTTQGPTSFERITENGLSLSDIPKNAFREVLIGAGMSKDEADQSIKENIPALDALNQVWNVAKYVIPGVNVAAIGLDAAQMAALTSMKGPVEAGKELLNGMVEGVNIFDPNITLAERAGRLGNLLLVGLGTVHLVGKGGTAVANMFARDVSKIRDNITEGKLDPIAQHMGMTREQMLQGYDAIAPTSPEDLAAKLKERGFEVTGNKDGKPVIRIKSDGVILPDKPGEPIDQIARLEEVNALGDARWKLKERLDRVFEHFDDVKQRLRDLGAKVAKGEISEADAARELSEYVTDRIKTAKDRDYIQAQTDHAERLAQSPIERPQPGNSPEPIAKPQQVAPKPVEPTEPVPVEPVRPAETPKVEPQQIAPTEPPKPPTTPDETIAQGQEKLAKIGMSNYAEDLLLGDHPEPVTGMKDAEMHRIADEAYKKLNENDPNGAANYVRSLIEANRPLRGDEYLVAFKHYETLLNEQTRAASELRRLKDSGANFGIAEAEARVKAAGAAADEWVDLIQKDKGRWSNAGRALNMGIDPLSGKWETVRDRLSERYEANTGEKPSAKWIEDLKVQHEELKEANQLLRELTIEHEKTIKGLQEDLAKKPVQELKTEAKTAMGKAARGWGKRKLRTVEELEAEWAKQKDALRQSLGSASSGLNTETLKALADMALNRLELLTVKGIGTFENVFKSMREDTDLKDFSDSEILQGMAYHEAERAAMEKAAGDTAASMRSKAEVAAKGAGKPREDLTPGERAKAYQEAGKAAKKEEAEIARLTRILENGGTKVAQAAKNPQVSQAVQKLRDAIRDLRTERARQAREASGETAERDAKAMEKLIERWHNAINDIEKKTRSNPQEVDPLIEGMRKQVQSVENAVKRVAKNKADVQAMMEGNPVSQPPKKTSTFGRKIAEAKKSTPENVINEELIERGRNARKQQTRIEELREQLRTGKVPKRDSSKPWFYEDPVEEAVRAHIAHLNKNVQAMVNGNEAELSGSTFAKFVRAGALSRLGTVGKLGAAVTENIAFKSLEDAAGHLINKPHWMRTVAEMAPREGYTPKGATWKGVKYAISKETVKDVMKSLKMQPTDLDKLFDHPQVNKNVMDWFGYMHKAVKSVALRKEFATSFETRLQYYEKRGVNVKDPMIRMKIGSEAYADAKGQILLRDNMITNAYNARIRELDRTYPTVANIGRSLLPIVSVPTNYAITALDYFPILPNLVRRALFAERNLRGTPQAKNRLLKGFTDAASRKLTPEQADAIMRASKRGGIGAVAMLLGYFNPDLGGGFYGGPEDTKNPDVHPGDIGWSWGNIGHKFLHHPIFELFQMGGTIRRFNDSLGEEQGHPMATLKAVGHSAANIASNIPFVERGDKLFDLLRTAKRGGDVGTGAQRTLGQFVKNLLIPGLLQETATTFDKKDEEPFFFGERQKRDQDAFWKEILAGVPGARQQLEKKE